MWNCSVSRIADISERLDFYEINQLYNFQLLQDFIIIWIIMNIMNFMMNIIMNFINVYYYFRIFKFLSVLFVL